MNETNKKPLLVDPNNPYFEGIFIPPNNLATWSDNVKEAGLNGIVLINGGFDLIHINHILFLKNVQDEYPEYEVLVALNTDERIRQLKGDNRPVHNLEERIIIMASIVYATYVTYFEEDDASALLRLIRPEVYAKGLDYKGRTYPEIAVCEELGITQAFLPPEKTTGSGRIIDRLI